MTDLIKLLKEAAGQIDYLSEALTNLSEGDDEPHDPSEDQDLLKRIEAAIKRFKPVPAPPTAPVPPAVRIL